MADEDVAGLTPTILSEDDLKNVEGSVAKALKVLRGDRDDSLLRIDRYMHQQVDGPYIPSGADTEYRLLAERCVSDWLIPALNAPAQSLFVEGHRIKDGEISSPAWQVWQENRLDARQGDLYRDALSFGQSFVAVEKPGEGRYAGRVRTLLMSALNTVALWEDPVNDDRPAMVVHVRVFPTETKDGFGTVWDREHVYDAAFPFDADKKITLSNATAHGASDTPVVPFYPYRDLLGRPRGIIAPLIPILDRINQTMFDLMVAQTYGSFKVRYITGMVPPPKRERRQVTLAEAIDQGKIDPGDPEYAGMDPTAVVGTMLVDAVDASGEPVRENLIFSPSRMMVVEDEHAKVGQLDETSLAGYIESVQMSVQHLSAIAQVPPQYLTGSIANLSADALAALEASLSRMVAELQHSFGESWEQVMQLCAELGGLAGADEFDSEVIWRDMSSRSLSQVVDALGKAVKMLDVPARATWAKIPGVTSGEVSTWSQLRDDDATNARDGASSALARSLAPASSGWLDTPLDASDDTF